MRELMRQFSIDALERVRPTRTGYTVETDRRTILNRSAITVTNRANRANRTEGRGEGALTVTDNVPAP